MKNRIWEFIERRDPPATPPYAQPAASKMTALGFAVSLQAVMNKKFVISNEWMIEHHPTAKLDMAWIVIGAHRVSADNSNVAVSMAPLDQKGRAVFSRAIDVPPEYITVKAVQN